MRSIVPSPPRLTARSSPAAERRRRRHPWSPRPARSASGRAGAPSWPLVEQPAGSLAGQRRPPGRVVVEHEADRGHQRPLRLGQGRVDQVAGVVDAPGRGAGAGRGARNSTLPSAPREGRHHDAHDGGSEAVERGSDLPEHPAPHARVADDAPAPGRLGPSGLELRLHQERPGRRRAAERRATAGSTVRSEMNDRSATTHVGRRADVAAARRSRTLVRSRHLDPRVGPQALVELAVADVDGDDRGRAPLQQAVGEAAGGRPASRARRPATSTPKRSSAASSFSPPRLTKRGGGPSDLDGSSGRDQARRLVGRRAADRDPPGRDVGLRLLPARRQAPPDQLGVEPATQGSGRLPAAFLAGAFFLAGGLLGRGLLGGGLLGRRLLGRGLLGRGLLGRRLLRRRRVALVVRRLLAGGDCRFTSSGPSLLAVDACSLEASMVLVAARARSIWLRTSRATRSRGGSRWSPGCAPGARRRPRAWSAWTSPALTSSLTIASARAWVELREG